MSAAEDQYDAVIAPMLLAVALKCEELGMQMVCRAEWEPGESQITATRAASWSGGMTLAKYACHAHGNVDRLCATLAGKPGADRSIYLSRFSKEQTDGH